jgi:hypothetical protein
MINSVHDLTKNKFRNIDLKTYGHVCEHKYKGIYETDEKSSKDLSDKLISSEVEYWNQLKNKFTTLHDELDSDEKLKVLDVKII